MIIPINVFAQRGCCSWHGGVSHCGSSGYYICKDGTRSPTCTCSGGTIKKKTTKKITTTTTTRRTTTTTRTTTITTTVPTTTTTGAKINNIKTNVKKSNSDLNNFLLLSVLAVSSSLMVFAYKKNN